MNFVLQQLAKSVSGYPQHFVPRYEPFQRYCGFMGFERLLILLVGISPTAGTIAGNGHGLLSMLIRY
jgi:hypothetical protein